MRAPATLGSSAGWPPDVDVCDRCLALSQLTVDLAKVPILRPVPDPGDGSKAEEPPQPLLPPLVATAEGLAGTPGALACATVDVSPQRALALGARHRSWHADRVRQAAVDAGLAALCMCSPEYPAPLRELSDPPPVVYVRGDRAVIAGCPDNAISMVGTRHPTLVGREAARRIAAGIARCGGIVVSGMALGIDGASHDGALSVRGMTIAVLAGGADRPSPQSHRRLYARILDAGAVISEMPPGIQPFKWSFPARNRLIAALGKATVVVEAPRRSGALITVEQAHDLGRDVLAVPGSLASEMSEGTNQLLADGSGAVIDGAALAAHLGMNRVAGLAGPSEGPLAAVHAALALGPLSPVELSHRTQTSMGPGELELALLDLELAGWVARRPDGRYRVLDRWAA